MKEKVLFCQGTKENNDFRKILISAFSTKLPVTKKSNLEKHTKMALFIGGIGLLAFIALANGEGVVNVYRKLNASAGKSDASFQINEDIDIGIRTNQNVRGAAAVISEEVGGIIRSDSYRDIYNVRNNALDFENRARIKNKILGELNFSPDNSKTILQPSYGTRVLQVTVPNPAVMPDYRKIPNAWLSRETSEVPVDDRAWMYREPYGENVTPFNMPQDTVQMETKFGNPWGPAGIYNENIREGGKRLAKTYDFNPQVYERKQVSFSNPLIR